MHVTQAWENACLNYNFLKSGLKNGCCMDVTGLNHSEIKLQGLESAYRFSEADCGGTPASSDDEDEQAESDLEDKRDDADDGLEVRSDSDSDIDSDESESDEHPGPTNVDDHGNFVAPEGTVPLDVPPAPLTLRNLRSRGIRLGLRWPFGDEVGWELGDFTKYDSQGTHKGEFTVRFEDGQVVWFPVPPLAEYGCTADKRWCLFQPHGNTAAKSSDSDSDHEPRPKRKQPRTRASKRSIK